jgi:hypothetical protein
MDRILVYVPYGDSQSGLVPIPDLIDLGGDVEYFSDSFRYDGSLFVLSEEKRQEISLTIRVLHVYGRGWCWGFSPALRLARPFLLTNDASMAFVFSGGAVIEPNADLRTVIQHPDCRHLPIGAEKWIGVVTLKGRSKRKGKGVGHLIAYSAISSAQPEPGEVVAVPTNRQLVGKIVGLPPKQHWWRSLWRRWA